MDTVLLTAHIVISVLLILAILTQNRGTGLSATFGGSGGFFVEKRGAEKVLYRMTQVLTVLFVISSLGFLFV